MSKKNITQEIHKELDKLNDRIDRKIIKGHSFAADARRHKELLATLRQLEVDTDMTTRLRRPLRRVKSPVRRRLNAGVVSRLFGMRLA